LEGHNQWIKSGFDEGIFLLKGSLQPGLGGSAFAFNTSLSERQNRVDEDPFIEQGIVTAKFLEIDPKQADKRLEFLLS
jgi:uncharacterized protein YciI